MSCVASHRMHVGLDEIHEETPFDLIVSLLEGKTPIAGIAAVQPRRLFKSLQLPGLLVPVDDRCYGDSDPQSRGAGRIADRAGRLFASDELLNTEESEGIRHLQLPGLLVAPSDPSYPKVEKPFFSHGFPRTAESVECGEIEEVHDLQLPGLLVDPEPHDQAIDDPLRQTEASDAERFRGLCATCNHVADCTFPRSEAGVWHCDEYA